MSATEIHRIGRRRFGVMSISVLLVSAGEALAGPLDLVVHKSPSCGCCDGWVRHMKAAGFRATVVNAEDLQPLKRRLGVPEAAISCHTGVAGGYFIEGHVPAQDVKRLLRERPRALGLAVAGMPQGSPGMESADGRTAPYETLLVTTAGTRVFARHGGASRR
jgi:hypothetical protein